MFGGVLDKVAGYLDKRFVLNALIPTVAFALATTGLVSSACGWSTTQTWWDSHSSDQQVLLGSGAALAILVLAFLLAAEVGPATRWLEGYWPSWWPACWARYLGVGLQRRRLARLDPNRPDEFEQRYRCFPRSNDDLLPTRFGNVLRAAERYPSDDGRYGLDAVFFWPRLVAVMPETMRSILSDARASMDFLVVITVLSASFVCGSTLFLAVVGGPAESWGVAIGAGLTVCIFAYRGAVAAAIVYGELVRTSFDLYRCDLLAQLGYAAPGSLAEERKVWENLGQLLYRRSASDESVLHYRHAGD